MARAKKKRVARSESLRISPTAEQMQHGAYVSAGMAFRKTPVIDTMLQRGQLNETEHRALWYYRDQAGLADKSETRSCLDIQIAGGTGHGPTAAIVSALMETGRIERDLGSLQPIARAIAVDDLSLSQWCVNQHGGRERYDGNGRFVAIVPLNERENMQIAIMHLKMAAHRITA